LQKWNEISTKKYDFVNNDKQNRVFPGYFLGTNIVALFFNKQTVRERNGIHTTYRNNIFTRRRICLFGKIYQRV